MKIFIKKIEGVSLPKRGSDKSAGYDIITTSEPKIIGEQYRDCWRRIDYIEYETNLYIAPAAMTFHTLIHPRSSVSKYNLILANSIGLVDNDYRGMVICRFKYVFQPEDLTIVENLSGNCGPIVGKVNSERIYKKGDVFAQLKFAETIQADWEFVDDLDQTVRGSGGFGSTDKKLGFDPNPAPKIVPKPELERLSLADMYNKSGGISVKQPYSEEIKQRQRE